MTCRFKFGMKSWSVCVDLMARQNRSVHFSKYEARFVGLVTLPEYSL